MKISTFDLTKNDIKDLPEIPIYKAFKEAYETILLVQRGRKEQESGYATIDVVLTKNGKCVGKLMASPDSISLEERNGCKWHVDCLPKSGAMQLWATGDNQIKRIRVFGGNTVYLEIV